MIGFDFYLYSIFKKVIYTHCLKKSLKENQYGFIYNIKKLFICYKNDEFLQSYLQK